MYNFNSEIEGLSLFYYDTLGYSLINEKISYPNTELITTYYYQNNLLVKITRNFSFNRIFEYSYDSLGRLIYEDLLSIPYRVYYNYDNDLLDKAFEISKLGDTIKKTTYHYVLDSLQRPIQINTLIENYGDETKKTTTIIQYK